MNRFPVYGATARSARATFFVPSFAPKPDRVLLGEIVTPEGVTMYRPDSPMPKLKIAKDGRPGEFWLYNARDAIRAARRGVHGLQWQRADVNVSSTS